MHSIVREKSYQPEFIVIQTANAHQSGQNYIQCIEKTDRREKNYRYQEMRTPSPYLIRPDAEDMIASAVYVCNV